ncbi:MAG: hypothetical protein M0Z56_08260, partial [Desulfobacteraceae bacterium]|nr:hypothetical protein [Desulfobacteraceae bacterium]
MSEKIKPAPAALTELESKQFLKPYGVPVVNEALAATPAQAKMSQKVAEYQLTPKDNQTCANCALYRAPSSCTLI